MSVASHTSWPGPWPSVTVLPCFWAHPEATPPLRPLIATHLLCPSQSPRMRQRLEPAKPCGYCSLAAINLPVDNIPVLNTAAHMPESPPSGSIRRPQALLPLHCSGVLPCCSTLALIPESSEPYVHACCWLHRHLPACCTADICFHPSPLTRWSRLCCAQGPR